MSKRVIAINYFKYFVLLYLLTNPDPWSGTDTANPAFRPTGEIPEILEKWAFKSGLGIPIYQVIDKSKDIF